MDFDHWVVAREKEAKERGTVFPKNEQNAAYAAWAESRFQALQDAKDMINVAIHWHESRGDARSATAQALGQAWGICSELQSGNNEIFNQRGAPPKDVEETNWRALYRIKSDQFLRFMEKYNAMEERVHTLEKRLLKACGFHNCAECGLGCDGLESEFNERPPARGGE